MNTNTPTFQSPIQAEAVAGAGLSITDLTGAPVILIQGNFSAGLPEGLPLPDSPGKILAHGGLLLGRLTHSEVLLFGAEPLAVAPDATALERHFAASGSFAHATDLTHGQAIVKLSGSTTVEALNKICGLNFADSVFSSGQVKQTSAAKVKTLIARWDEGDSPTYFLQVSRPFGQYFWDTLLDAAQEFLR